MKLNPIAANQTEIESPDGKTVLYSYKTPVAVFVPGKGAMVTSYKWSVTTSKHIRAFLMRHNLSATHVEQSAIDALAS